MNCNVCQLNCPGDAIPQDYVVTHGVKRWLIDLEKCYPYSRLRDEYCHLCVDVRPYNVKSHPEPYRAFMKLRRRAGYKTPKTSSGKMAEEKVPATPPSSENFTTVVSMLRANPDRGACRYEIVEAVRHRLSEKKSRL